MHPWYVWYATPSWLRSVFNSCLLCLKWLLKMNAAPVELLPDFLAHHCSSHIGAGPWPEAILKCKRVRSLRHSFKLVVVKWTMARKHSSSGSNNRCCCSLHIFSRIFTTVSSERSNIFEIIALLQWNGTRWTWQLIVYLPNLFSPWRHIWQF